MVIFAVVELIILPFAAQAWLYREPMVAGAWMGLAVKTDGAAAASGAMVDALIRSKAMSALGVKWQEGWMLMATTTVKVFIDIFIAIWAFILAIIWSWKIDRREGEPKGGGKGGFCTVSLGHKWLVFCNRSIIAMMVAITAGFRMVLFALTLKSGIRFILFSNTYGGV